MTGASYLPLRIVSTKHRACVTGWSPRGSPTTQCPRATVARHPPHITQSRLAPKNARSRPTLPDAAPPPSLPPPSLRSSPSAQPPPLDRGAEGGALPPLHRGAEGGSLPPGRRMLPRFVAASLRVLVALVTLSQTHAVGLVWCLWPTHLRFRFQVQMNYPQVLLGWRRAVSGEPPASRRRDVLIFGRLEVCHGY